MNGMMGDDAQLENAMRELRHAWADTELSWRDQARRDFQDQHLDPLEARLRSAAKAASSLDTLIRGAIQQCSN